MDVKKESEREAQRDNLKSRDLSETAHVLIINFAFVFIYK